MNEGQQQWVVKYVSPEIPALPFAVQEAVNVLRGNIQLSGSGIRAVAITSAMKSEGKSTLAVQLAKSFAALKKSTVYFDCDIRKSKTLRRYNINEKVIGLTEYLCGRCRMQDIIYGTDDEFMDMIFTGAVAPNPSELVTSELFSQLLERLKKEYDCVIVDTPPINAVIDGAMICKRCDGTVMVIGCGITERAQALRMKRQLSYAGVKVIGAVLNEVGKNSAGYGYDCGYGYGYGYGREEDEGKRGKKAKKQS